MASKVFFGAIEFGVFTELAKQPLDGQALTERLGLHLRSARDFLDASRSIPGPRNQPANEPVTSNPRATSCGRLGTGPAETVRRQKKGPSV